MVVELFQSQGCSSCPPANANLAAVADKPGVIALNFSVTYWDDSLERHLRPAEVHRPPVGLRPRFGRGNVFTPQVVVNGRHDGVGADAGDFARLVGAAGGRAGPR